MRQLQALLHDRRRRQRGSVLSALLIIVVFLSILIGALLTEVTDAFVLSRDLVTRVQTEATVSSAVELAISHLQTDVQKKAVPANCAQDARKPTPMPTPLNGQFAVVTQQTCTAILPEVAIGLQSGSSTVDGIHDTVAGRNRYLVGDTSGRLTAYPFGTTSATWSIGLGGALTAPPLTVLSTTHSDGPVDILVPVAGHAGCVGPCVAVFNDTGGSPAFHCILDTAGTVTSRPAAEVTAGGSPNFPSYAFIADSAGNLYVYDTGPCGQAKASAHFSGSVAGPPLVFQGRPTGGGSTTTVNDEIFVLVTSGSGTTLQHWTYTESTTCSGNGDQGDCGGNGQQVTTYGLSHVGDLPLGGANAVGYALSSNVPPLNLAVATKSGRLDLAQIRSGPSYTMAQVASIALPNGSLGARAPYWCHCPGQDLIGVGATNGYLYLYNNTLNLAYSYDGQLDGRPAINTTPMADVAGDWYFGADDGFVYDVEIPLSGQQLFKAARFGPGGAIGSSPVVGTCSSTARPVDPCMYFASSTTGGYFARIGVTRVSDLRACLSSAAGSTNCVGNPHLWARVQVGPAAIWGANGAYVQGWSFYSA